MDDTWIIVKEVMKEARVSRWSVSWKSLLRNREVEDDKKREKTRE